MKGFVIIAVILLVCFLGYRYFNDKKTTVSFKSVSTGSSSTEAPRVANNTEKSDHMEEINELGKKAEEWKNLLAQMKTFLSSVTKEMQEEPNKNKEVQ